MNKVDTMNQKPMPCYNLDENGYPLENMAHWNGYRFVSDAELESMSEDLPRPQTRKEILELKAFFEESLTYEQK